MSRSGAFPRAGQAAEGCEIARVSRDVGFAVTGMLNGLLGPFVRAWADLPFSEQSLSLGQPPIAGSPNSDY
jgi:hypothetical protein